jgi:predicted RNase H-like HicB family nuclease
MAAKVKKAAKSSKKQGRLRLTAAVTREGNLYVAQCLEVDVASQGESLEESLENLQEALELYLEDDRHELPRATPIIAPVEVKVA